MTISEMIARLEEMKTAHGDLEIFIDPNSEYTDIIYDYADLFLDKNIPYAVENGKLQYKRGIVIF